jgi:hypothetical protein
LINCQVCLMLIEEGFIFNGQPNCQACYKRLFPQFTWKKTPPTLTMKNLDTLVTTTVRPPVTMRKRGQLLLRSVTVCAVESVPPIRNVNTVTTAKKQSLDKDDRTIANSSGLVTGYPCSKCHSWHIADYQSYKTNRCLVK